MTDPTRDQLATVTARVVDELTGGALLFTALDVSNAVKQALPGARHREVAPIVRALYDRGAMGAYTQTMIDVMAGGSTPARAFLYHLPEHATTMYDDRMRAQVATPPSHAARQQPDLGQSAREAQVYIGQDGRARIARQLLQNAGIVGDRVIVTSDPLAPKLTIVAGAPSGLSPFDALFAMADLRTVTDSGQALAIDHPSLLQLPREMVQIFGADPKLVARIDGTSIVVVRAP
ncbi:MAG TPA: hypothetical protein VLX92_04735 [Kofleriaceae bacterium]|nr:hypothetical protein [Kofleriaceae bacterium]